MDEVRELIALANNLISLVDALLASGRPPIAQGIVYVGAKYFLQLLVLLLEQIARQLAIEQIQQVVGNDFTADAVSGNDPLYDRVALLPTITDLQTNYGITLIGSGNESLGVWLSSATANLSLVTTVLQAVVATAQNLYGLIDSWGNPMTGYLRGGLTVSTYLASLQNATSAPAAFHLVAFDGAALSVTLAASSYTDTSKLFGYLDGWDYAKFARRLIQIDHDIYQATYNAGQASRLWNENTWLPTANALLRTDWSGVSGFAHRGITSIDPVYSLAQNSPSDLIQDFRHWVDTTHPPVCGENPPLCPDDCYVLDAYTSTSNGADLAWAGAPRSSAYLPFFPKSIITGCPPARRSLARGIMALWSEIGIYQDMEDVTRLVNALEHGTALPTPDARQALFQYLHHIYHTTETIFAPLDVEYIAGMTSAILDYDNNVQVDIRTYQYLINMLTPVAELPELQINPSAIAVAEGYATESLGDFAWGAYNSDLSLYNADVQLIISQGATRTFGSTEFNILTDLSQDHLIDDTHNGLRNEDHQGGWVAFYPLNSSIQNGINGAPFGVFLMTPAQFDIAQGLPKRL